MAEIEATTAPVESIETSEAPVETSAGNNGHEASPQEKMRSVDELILQAHSDIEKAVEDPLTKNKNGRIGEVYQSLNRVTRELYQALSTSDPSIGKTVLNQIDQRVGSLPGVNTVVLYFKNRGLVNAVDDFKEDLDGYTTEHEAQQGIVDRHTSEIEHLKREGRSYARFIKKEDQNENKLLAAKSEMQRLVLELEAKELDNPLNKELSEQVKGAQKKYEELDQTLREISGQREVHRRKLRGISGQMRAANLKYGKEILYHNQSSRMLSNLNEIYGIFEQYVRRDGSIMIITRNLEGMGEMAQKLSGLINIIEQHDAKMLSRFEESPRFALDQTNYQRTFELLEKNKTAERDTDERLIEQFLRY